jgi:hypothetical protein
MIRHIVLFKFKAQETEALKAEKLEGFKKGLEALPAIIPQVKLLKVGLNSNPSEQFDMSLLTEFETMEDLHTYAIHPEHQKVSVQMREIMEARACVDSEF